MAKNCAGETWTAGRDKLRILYCSEDYCPHDHRFLSALAESEGNEIFWFRLEGGDRVQEERPLPDGIQPVAWATSGQKVNWLDYPRLQKQFAKVIERVQPDVIHAGPVQRVAFLAALNAFHPLVTMSWGFDMLQDADKNMFWKQVTRFVLTRSDWLIADCHTVKNKAVLEYGFNPNTVTVFPWGVDLDLFSPIGRAQARKEIGFTDDLLVIHTRSWEPRYGVDIALRGFRIALEKNPKMQMIMLGGGSQRETVRHYVNEHGLADNIHFAGYQPNEKLVQYYRAGDIYLSASHVDGSSVALLEAMGCGCVPLVSGIPSNLEWVHEGQTGWSFRDDFAEGLAEKLAKAGQADLRSMRKNTRAKIEANADWEKGKKKLLQTYKDVIAKEAHG